MATSKPACPHDFNLDKRETNETAFDPESKVERSTRTLKETSNSQNSNTKWNVSVEQNIPNEQGGSKPQDQSRKSSERKEETNNFELSSKTTTTISDGYRIENIAVAVVVNRKPLLASFGDSKPTAIDEQIKSIEKLVTSAAGLQPARGDKATVVAVDFAGGAELDPAATSPTLLDPIVGKTGDTPIAAAIVLSTIIFVSLGMRPAMRLIVESRKPALEATQRTEEPKLVQVSGEPALESDSALIAQPTLAGPVAPKRPSSIKQVEKAIDENEELAAEVLRQWIREG